MAPLLIAARAAFTKIPQLYASSPALRAVVDSGVNSLASETPAPDKAKDSLLGLFSGTFADKVKDKASGMLFDSAKDSIVSSLFKSEGLMSSLKAAGTALIGLAIAALTQFTDRMKGLREEVTGPKASAAGATLATAKPEAAAPQKPPTISVEDQRKSDLEWEMYLISAVNRDLERNAKKAEETPGIHPGVAQDFRHQIEQNTRLLEVKKAELSGSSQPSLQALIAASGTPSITLQDKSAPKEQAAQIDLAATDTPQTPFGADFFRKGKAAQPEETEPSATYDHSGPSR